MLDVTISYARYLGPLELTLDWIDEGGMQVVDYLSEAFGWLLVSFFVKEVNLNVPRLHGESLHFGGLVTWSIWSAGNLAREIGVRPE
jgi:hypothetical protein